MTRVGPAVRSIALLCLLATTALADETGTVCLSRATWSVPRGVLTPGAAPPPRVKKYEVRIDDGEAIDVTTRSSRVDGLALTGKHRVQISADGKVIETFFFTFAERGPKLVLNHHDFYGSWSLDVAKRDCR
jgi:hypothetical protein